LKAHSEDALRGSAFVAPGKSTSMVSWRCFSFFLNFPDFIEMRGESQMKVVVQNNQIEKAIKDLKRKLTKEGFFSEIKERRFYDKPSVQKKKKQAKAAKRRRKRMRRF
jgi:small subunit ribosomal protein S21